MQDVNHDDITGLLIAWRGGDAEALATLMPVTYRSLKAVAGRLLRGERRGQSLETTALVHEAYLRLAELEGVSWQDRAHFYAITARMMRQILVDHARSRGRLKRGAGQVLISVDQLEPTADTSRTPDLLALDDALRDLAEIDADRARVVELRFFGGLGRDEMAEVLGISATTVARRWRSARAWLLNYLETADPL